MPLSPEVVAARVHLRVCELRELAASTFVQLARHAHWHRPAPASWRVSSPSKRAFLLSASGGGGPWEKGA
jgi:hypothetical protein